MGFSKLGIQSKLILMLLLVCIGSIVAIGVIAHSVGKESLTRGIFNELDSIRASKKYQIESQFRLIRNQVVNLGNDPTVIEAMLGLRANYSSFSDLDVKPGSDEKLRNYYANDFLPKLALSTGGHPILEAYLPRTPTGRYLQYEYIANNPYPTGEKYKLADAKDGSSYSSVHARFHGVFTKFVLDFGYENLYLIDTKGNVVYTTGKSPVFATNLLDGPYANTNLAEMYRGLVDAKEQDAVKLVDFQRIDAALGKPVAFIGCPIFDGPNEIGVVAIELPVDEINRVATGAYGWERDGLGKTGEVILVGADALLRSQSRLLHEDKAKYFDQLEAAGYSEADMAQVRKAGTALLAQPARIRAVANALAGKQSEDIEKDYRGQSTLVSYAPLDIDGLHWVILALMETREAFDPLYRLTQAIVSWSVLIVLLVTLLAAFLAHHFVKPIYRLVDAAKQFKAGKTDVKVDFSSHDEYRDLGTAFDEMTASIHTQAARIRTQEKRNQELLLNVAPEEVAERIGKGETEIAERYSDVTVIDSRLMGFTEATETLPAEKAISLMNEIVTAFDEAAERHRVTRLRTSGYSYLGLCGTSELHLDHSRRVVSFARELVQILSRFNRERGVHLGICVGISAGPVTGGVVGRPRFTYDLFGETVDVARALAAEGRVNAILVSESVHDSVHDLFEFHGPVQMAGGEGRVWMLELGVKEAVVSPRAGETAMDGAAGVVTAGTPLAPLASRLRDGVQEEAEPNGAVDGRG